MRLQPDSEGLSSSLYDHDPDGIQWIRDQAGAAGLVDYQHLTSLLSLMLHAHWLLAKRAPPTRTLSQSGSASDGPLALAAR